MCACRSCDPFLDGTNDTVKIVINELNTSCVKLDASEMFNDSSFSLSANGGKLGAMAALKLRHCIQLVCEPTVALGNSANDLLLKMESLKSDVDHGSLIVDPTTSKGKFNYFLSYISNSCHVPLDANTNTVCSNICA